MKRNNKEKDLYMVTQDAIKQSLQECGVGYFDILSVVLKQMAANPKCTKAEKEAILDASKRANGIANTILNHGVCSLSEIAKGK